MFRITTSIAEARVAAILQAGSHRPVAWIAGVGQEEVGIGSVEIIDPRSQKVRTLGRQEIRAGLYRLGRQDPLLLHAMLDESAPAEGYYQALLAAILGVA